MSHGLYPKVNVPAIESDVKDMLLYLVGVYFYPEEDLSRRRVEFHEKDDWISISITTHGFDFNPHKLPKFDIAASAFGYRFSNIWSRWDNNRLVFILAEISE